MSELKTWEYIKAFQEGKTIEVWIDDNWVIHKFKDISTIVSFIENGKQLRVVQIPVRLITIEGRLAGSSWVFEEVTTDQAITNTHKICFFVDSDDNPIFDLVKMGKK